MKRSIVLPVCIIMIYAMTVPLNMSLRHGMVSQAGERDIIQRMFGGLRDLVGDWAFMKAEEYHHRGLPFLLSVGYHKGESFAHEEEHHDEHVQSAPKDLFSRVYSSVKVTADSHLKPSEEKEALPWFYTEVAFNPNDVRGYVLGSYWLERMGRPEESMKFLAEGEKNNPGAASILASIGILYYKTHKDAEAVRYLEKARSLWQEGKFPNDISSPYAKSDRLIALNILGSLYERSGRYQDAISAYEEMYSLNPSKTFSDKIKRLNTGKQ